MLMLLVFPKSFAWPIANPFSASANLPSTWENVHIQSDHGALRLSSSMFMAATNGDTLISFSVQPSVVETIPHIYLAAYSLESGALISPVGMTTASSFWNLGIDVGGLVSLRIPAATVSALAVAANGNSAVRLAVIAPESATILHHTPADNGKAASPATSRWASDSAILYLRSPEPPTAAALAQPSQQDASKNAHA
ncbi:hypothetical protein EDC05_002357 [Coemansia umbellata]|nr:hypothetical protein EDC05_002357 [Coemansia umbellata]